MDNSVNLKDIIENDLSSELIMGLADIEKIECITNKMESLSQKRPDYSVISEFVFDGMKMETRYDEKFEIIDWNLNTLIEHCENNSLHILERYYAKIKGHIKLALIQRKHINESLITSQKEAETLKGLIRKLDNETKELTITADKAKDNLEATEKELNGFKNTMYTSFVAILGIFTAIVFGAFGGMEILSNVMTNIDKVRIPKLLMFSSLIIAAILTVLYLLLNSIANLTGLTIRSCGCKDTSKCTHNIFKRHPVFITGIVISLYLFTIGVLAQGFKTTNFSGIKPVDSVMSYGISLLVIAGIGLYFVIKFLSKMNGKTRSNK